MPFGVSQPSGPFSPCRCRIISITFGEPKDSAVPAGLGSKTGLVVLADLSIAYILPIIEVTKEVLTV